MPYNNLENKSFQRQKWRGAREHLKTRDRGSSRLRDAVWGGGFLSLKSLNAIYGTGRERNDLRVPIKIGWPRPSVTFRHQVSTQRPRTPRYLLRRPACSCKECTPILRYISGDRSDRETAAQQGMTPEALPIGSAVVIPPGRCSFVICTARFVDDAFGLRRIRDRHLPGLG